MSAAIYYTPEAYSTNGPKLMGRNSAGESFLRGYLKHSRADSFWVQSDQAEHARQYVETVKAAGRNEPVKTVSRTNLADLARAGTVYFPAPNIGDLAWHRATFGHGAWSLCGITHTISTASAMDGLANLLTAPVQPWDAVICTSTGARNVVERIFQAHTDYLSDRLGAQRLVYPQLPVIPLGINTQDFVHSSEQREEARRSWCADESTLVVLFSGRLSFHAKAHPLVMYQALEQAAATLHDGKKVLLVECGRHSNAAIAQAFSEAARLACPSVRVLALDGREGDNYQRAWAGADVFCSLSDNLQETFGLTPLEAMAAGLPVVVSDWDGYKDTVRDGIDGFRIPTLMPAAGQGVDLARRHALEIDSYDRYCGHTCSLVAIDVQATARAFESLFASSDLRRRMGSAGRRRAREVFDWVAIIPQYEALWDELAEVRSSKARQLKPLAHPWPARMDPFHTFSSYATVTLTTETLLALADFDLQNTEHRVSTYRKLAMVNFAEPVLPPPSEVRTLLHAASRGPQHAAEFADSLPVDRRPTALTSLAWLVKLGALKVVPPGTRATTLP